MGKKSNYHDTYKVLSVKLGRDGLSYSVILSDHKVGEKYVAFGNDGISLTDSVKEVIKNNPDFAESKYSKVQVLLDTADTIYVPEEVLTADIMAAAYLNEAGISYSADEKVVISPATDGLCAVMPFDGKVIEHLSSVYGEKATYFSPLQENIEISRGLELADGAIIVNVTSGNIYVAIYNTSDRLIVTEVYPYASLTDIIYYLHCLSSGHFSGKGRIYIYGPHCGKISKPLKKYFRNILCV